MPYVQFVLGFSDGYGRPEFAPLEHLCLTTSKGEEGSTVDPVLHYVNTYLATGGEGEVPEAWVGFALPIVYFRSFALGKKWGTLPHRAILFQMIRNCELGRDPLHLIDLHMDKVQALDSD